MVRLILYVLLLAGMATGAAWLADRPGSISVEWLGYHAETSVFIAAILLAVLFLALIFAGWLVIILWTGPRRIRRKFASRRRRLGMEAIRRGIFAAGSGNAIAASRAASSARRTAPDDSLTLLLQAQSAQLLGDAIGARQSFERMLSSPEMAGLGLRGLYIEAKRAGEMEAAKQFAERALAADPSLPWPPLALFDMQVREGNWRGALRTLSLARQHKHLDRQECNRRRAIVLTALARALEDKEAALALDYALEAHNIAPALVPAAVTAGRILASQGNSSRAAKVIAQTWKLNPHPDLALIHAHARPGDSPRDRLARVKALAASGPKGIEADIAIATAAIEAKDWDSARTALQPYVAARPAGRICLLMARIEAGQHRDTGRAREWMARAARGAPDPVWVAADGSLSKEWRPVSASGALGAYEWKLPPSDGASGDGDDFLAEITSSPEPDSPSGPEQAAAVADAEVIDVTPPPPEREAPKPAERPVYENGMAAREIAVPPPDAPPGNALVAKTKPARLDADGPGRSGGFLDGYRAKPGFDPPEAQDGGPAPKAPAPKPASAEPKPKMLPRAPNIFLSGRAPDDPGPREADNPDEPSTPISRFRRPH
jgi:HemY protein